jgi:hypothetical protein
MSGYKFEITKGTDTIRVEILPDGTVKTETDSISAANHGTAENFLNEIFRLAGGKSTLEFKRPVPVMEQGHTHHHHH